MAQPVDPTTEISRAAAVERIQQLTSRTDLAGQARLAAGLAREQVGAESTVDRPEAKQSEVDRDLRRRNPYGGRRRRREPAPEQEATPEARTFYTPDEHVVVVEEARPHGLDISV